ncbi:hypothetical protein ACFE04_001949 [Oxalis oulophora]
MAPQQMQFATPYQSWNPMSYPPPHLNKMNQSQLAMNQYEMQQNMQPGHPFQQSNIQNSSPRQLQGNAQESQVIIFAEEQSTTEQTTSDGSQQEANEDQSEENEPEIHNEENEDDSSESENSAENEQEDTSGDALSADENTNGNTKVKDEKSNFSSDDVIKENLDQIMTQMRLKESVVNDSKLLRNS